MISGDAALELLQGGTALRIQYANTSGYNPESLTRVNELSKAFPGQITLRFWGHMGEAFDFKNFVYLPDVDALTIETMRAEHWEDVETLPNLKRLVLGINETKDLKILDRLLHDNLQSLILPQIRSKALDLSPLVKAQHLRELSIFGHRKNISSVSQLKGLEVLSFSPHSKDSYPYIDELPKLRQLEFHLGGRSHIDEVRSDSLTDLRFFQVRGLESLGDLNRFKRLNYLSVENQPRLDKADYEETIKNIHRVSWR